MLKIKKAVIEFVRSLDQCLLWTALFCSAFGLVLIYSAARSMDGGSTRYLVVQVVAIILGLIGFGILSCVDLDRYSPMWRAVFVVNIIFQLSLVVFGMEDGGNKSWIRFFGIGIQPAEVGKLLFVFTFAKHIQVLRYELNRVSSLLQLGLHLAAMMLAIILPSGDVGMSLPYVFIALVMLFAAGVSLKWFAGGGIFLCAAIPILWQVLGEYQKKRILVLFDASVSPDTYWQQQQSRIAIGSGKWTGTGYLNGNQTQNNMLPEKHTDFIFGVAGEEWGMLGCLIILAALMILIIRVFYISYHAVNQTMCLMTVGVGSMLLFQTFENIFMCLGIGPVMGLTLPLFSYGGSSVVTTYLALGIASGVSNQYRRKRQQNLPESEEILTAEPEAADRPHKKIKINVEWLPKMFSKHKEEPVQQPKEDTENTDNT